MRIEIPSGLQSPVVTPEQHVLGAVTDIVDPINSTGQWEKHLPFTEPQRKHVETMACTSFHTLNPIEILLKYQHSRVENFSDRYLAVRSGTKETGNDPHAVAETMRKYAGAIPEATLQNVANTWDDYYSGLVYGHRKLGFDWLKKWKINHDWVLLPGKKYSPAQQQTLLAQGLKHSPLGVAVDAWQKDGEVYVKRRRANHWTTLIGYEPGKCWYVFDSYKPYIKRLEWDYHFEYAKRYQIQKRDVHDLEFWIRAYSGLFGLK